MRPLVGEFNFTRLESVLYGPGKIEMLSRELARRGAKRAVIVTTKTLGRSRLLDGVKAAIGPALAGVFAETSQHVPSKTVAALVGEARARRRRFVRELRRRNSDRYREGRRDGVAGRDDAGVG